ncbi:MAG: tryptophan-rich sensory protein [Chitinophagales bacterium]|nr:tryptophan-rich sensory protein [Hyphomicrobiales bacterium]
MQRDNRTVYAVLGFVGACLIANGLIFGLGFDSGSSPAGPRTAAPPGWVVGAVWVALFAIMGVIYARLAERNSSARWLIVTLAVACLLYPVYTEGLSNLLIALIGNLATLGATLALALYLGGKDRISGALLTPMLAWLIFASYLTADALALGHKLING